MTVILVEGESDRIALATLAARMDVPLPEVLAVGGSKGVGRAVASLAGERILGLVDAGERTDFERFLTEVHVCDPDLEAELVRALGVDGVERVIEGQGELASFRRLQGQPAQRGRPSEAQLARFFGGRSGNKARYAQLLAAAIPLDAIPPPIAALFASLPSR